MFGVVILIGSSKELMDGGVGGLLGRHPGCDGGCLGCVQGSWALGPRGCQLFWGCVASLVPGPVPLNLELS